MNTGVYQIRNILNNHLYIGSSSYKTGIQGRWRKHRNQLRKNTHINKHLQRAWNKYGEKNFSFEILELCNKGQCLIKEQHYLNTLLPEYNLYKIAGSPKGRIVTQETRNKISKSLIGRKLDIETKKKISLSLKGKPKSQIHKQKVKEILWGKFGKLKNGNGGRFSGYYKFLNIETGVSIHLPKFKFADEYGIDRSFVYRLCNKKVNNCKRWICLGKV